MQRKVILLGATGYTGEMIAKLLKENQIKFTIAGRNLEKLEEFKAKNEMTIACQVVDISDESQVTSLLADSPILINCVGPYFQFCKTLVKTLAARSCAIYIDLTGEEAFVDWSITENHEAALKSGAQIIHSVSFESAYADLLSTLICMPGESFSEVSSVYYVNEGKASPGTYFTMDLGRYQKRWFLEGGAKQDSPPFSVSREFQIRGESQTAYYLPYPEISFFTRRYKLQKSISYFVYPEEDAKMYLGYSTAPPVPIELILKKHSSKSFEGPTEEERKEQTCWVSVIATNEAGETSKATMFSCDPYFITALMILESVKYFLSDNFIARPGVWGPGDVLPAQETLANIGVEVQIEEKLSAAEV